MGKFIALGIVVTHTRVVRTGVWHTDGNRPTHEMLIRHDE